MEDSPLKRGKVENWACAIIYTVGQLNFLFDPAIKPCIANFILCTYFDANQHSMWYKSRDIRRLLKLKLSDEEFSTKYVLSLNIPESKDDLKRIRTLGEVRSKYRHRRPYEPFNIKNIKLVNIISGVIELDEKEFKEESYSLIQSSYFVTGINRFYSKKDNKIQILLFTSAEKYESYKGNSTIKKLFFHFIEFLIIVVRKTLIVL